MNYELRIKIHFTIYIFIWAENILPLHFFSIYQKMKSSKLRNLYDLKKINLCLFFNKWLIIIELTPCFSMGGNKRRDPQLRPAPILKDGVNQNHHNYIYHTKQNFDTIK